MEDDSFFFASRRPNWEMSLNGDWWIVYSQIQRPNLIRRIIQRVIWGTRYRRQRE